jgi:hypothetical protein
VDKRVSLLGGFWHPKMGLVLYHFDEDGEPFIMTMPTLPREKAIVTYSGYVNDLKIGTKSRANRRSLN